MNVSVIIPMYNAENTIKRCIYSVLNQTYKGEIEVIVVNDGSRDNSKILVEEIIENNISNVSIFLINKENGGVSSARNVGLKMAKNELIAFLDSDDAWYAEKLTKQINIIKENINVDFLGSILSYKPWRRYIFKKIGYLTRVELTSLMFKFCFQPSTIIFKKRIINVVGYFNETQKYAEEGNYFMRIIYNGFGCYLMNEKLSYFGLNDKLGFGDGGLSGNLKEMRKGEILNFKYAYTNLNISAIVYYTALIFSFLKYIRRILLVYLR